MSRGRANTTLLAHWKRPWCWGQKVKRATEDEMIGWHHRFNGYELGQTLGDSEGQGSLACCSPWGSRRVGHDLATEPATIHAYSQSQVVT